MAVVDGVWPSSAGIVTPFNIPREYPMLNLTMPGYRMLDLLKSYMQISLENYYAHFTNRLLLYFVLGGIFLLEGLIALTFYKGPALLSSHMAFTTVYALHTALTYSFFQLAADVLACRLMPTWGCYPRRTVGKQWLIWSAGFVLAFIVHRTIVLCLVHVYAPEVIAYYADPHRLRPSHVAVFFYALPYWTAGVFLAVTITLQFQGRLSLKDRQAGPQQAASDGVLKVSVDNRSLEIHHSLISHITVEDHYSRIYFFKDDALHNIFIRTPLKVLHQSLPKNVFFQIHRSHLVNLAHVCGFSRKNWELKMKGTHAETALPVSRYRLSDLRSKLG